ncbi:MAG: pectate lyase, partial [Duncaniella sp.]|nr:pectate lyase [Duncaniella sp.]
MKKFALPIAALLVSSFSLSANEAAPAFPGAEGHGRYVTGGRGGKIIHVTNLNDSGAGSFRAALETTGKRVIVFDVAGTIHLNSDIKLKKGNVTILGQTAPGGGITVADYTFQVEADNVVVRFMRFRRGTDKNLNDGADASWGRNHHNIIFDHCSFSWSIDEVASYYDNENFTMQ